MRFLPIFFTIILLTTTQCKNKEVTLDKNNTISDLGNADSVSYYKANHGIISDTPDLIVNDKKLVSNIIHDICNSNSPRELQESNWNIIKIYFPDTTLQFYTDDTLIGLRNVGEFYQLPYDNFIARYKRQVVLAQENQDN